MWNTSQEIKYYVKHKVFNNSLLQHFTQMFNHLTELFLDKAHLERN